MRKDFFFFFGLNGSLFTLQEFPSTIVELIEKEQKVLKVFEQSNFPFQ